MTTPTIDQVNRRWFALCRALGITPNLDERGEPTVAPWSMGRREPTEVLEHERGKAS